MKTSKHKLTNVLVSLCGVIVLLCGFVYWSQMDDFSKSKWNNGFREDIIDDVMDNYVYPGVSLTDVIDNLASGIIVEDYIKSRYLSLFDLDNTMYDVIIYQIKNKYNDFDNIRDSYFVVIHDAEVVVKTLLVESLS